MPDSADPADAIEETEYFALMNTIASADQRLLTIKGWGVTLSLAALGLGFQYRAYGYFLVAALSSLAFWALEAAVKRHQMRYYPRMREIEVRRYRAAPPDRQEFSAPRIDWSWATAHRLFVHGERMPAIRPSGKSRAYASTWVAPHVALPHVLTLLAGAALFGLGVTGRLTAFLIGAAAK